MRASKTILSKLAKALASLVMCFTINLPFVTSGFGSETILTELSLSAQQCIDDTKYSPTFGEGVVDSELTPEKTKEAAKISTRSEAGR